MKGVRDKDAAALLPDLFGQAASHAASARKQPVTQPFSVRLSTSERQRLEAAAGRTALGPYIRGRLLGVTSTKAPRRVKPDNAALAKILAELGRSRLAAGVADLAAAARAGTIEITPELEAQIVALSAEVAEVRRLLVRALGLPSEARP